MTNEEAIIDIRENIQPIIGGKSLDIAISAIEKQIPKKPKVIFDEYSYFECGNCGEAIYCSDELKSHKYCLNCGQALDWSDNGIF